MNSNFKKIISVISVIAVALCMVTVGFAYSGPVIYLSYSKNSATGESYADVNLRSPKQIETAEITLNAADGVTVSGCFGLPVSGVLKSTSYTSSAAQMNLTIDSGSYAAASGIYAGRVAYSAESGINESDLLKIFTSAVLVLDGEETDCKIRVLSDAEEDSSADEPSSIINNPTTKPSEPSTAPDEPVIEPDVPAQDAFASAGCYVYTDFNNNTYVAVSLDLSAVKNMSVDLKADSAKFTVSEDVSVLTDDKNIKIESDSRTNTIGISASPVSGSYDGYIAYIPITLADGVSAYSDFSGAFTSNYGFVNGEKMNVGVETFSTAYSPEKYGDSWFRGFDATYNTYGDGEDMKEEYLIYAVGAGFAYNYNADFIFSNEVEVVSASAKDINGKVTLTENGDGSTTVSLSVINGENKYLDYQAILSVIVKGGDSDVSYKNIWDNISIDEFDTNGIEQAFGEFKNVSYLGTAEHYDTVDGVKYVSYDFAGKPGYSAVCGYTDEAGADIKVASKVRDGYTVAQINEYAFSSCGAKSITLPDTIELILEGAFENCALIEEFTFPENVYDIKDGAFAGCSSLAKLTFKNADKLESIGEYAFLDCESYLNIELPSGTYSIGDGAFGFVSDAKGNVERLDGVKIIAEYGSPARAYAQANGFDCINPGEEKFDIIKGEKVTMLYNAEGNYVIIPPAKKLGDIIDMFPLNGIKALADDKSNEITDEKAAVATGMKLILEDTDEEIDIVVRGDTNKNGTITPADARIALRLAARLDTADELTMLAADADYNGKVTPSDARMILRVAARLASF